MESSNRSAPGGGEAESLMRPEGEMTVPVNFYGPPKAPAIGPSASRSSWMTSSDPSLISSLSSLALDEMDGEADDDDGGGEDRSEKGLGFCATLVDALKRTAARVFTRPPWPRDDAPLWAVVVCLCYAAERTTFKIGADRLEPFRIVAAECMALSYAAATGAVVLYRIYVSGTLTKRLLNLGSTHSLFGSVFVMTILDTAHLVAAILSAPYVAPVLTVILMQGTTPAVLLLSQFRRDGACARACCCDAPPDGGASAGTDPYGYGDGAAGGAPPPPPSGVDGGEAGNGNAVSTAGTVTSAAPVGACGGYGA
eukprot:CAMPEP_0194327200 /NCGR_PEP_ID=MMETSP0171-20130528/40099_1 /TAXON_ID=218684 /ORGANISM="Corethron pennatum, Strain L29A3" /LENGTH=309 /DNA_ID=CAMNT_0039087075 /DNA_START=38 /DNA_END=963 /DNA_ORIENTATION=+